MSRGDATRLQEIQTVINAFGPKLERNILKIKADLAVTQLNDYLRFIKNNNSFGVLETKVMKKN